MTTPPKQVVILAGGRGTRLKPLTDHLPKPMISIHGKPFLHYLIEQFKEQGFEKVLLLLGYLPEVIQDYFGDGSSFGLDITYSITAEENDTGRRIYLARQQIEERFLLAYCDNYWPMQWEKMWKHFEQTKARAQITVYSNQDNYTRHNIRLKDGLVDCYDKNRTASDLEGVEIGFSIIDKEVLDLLPPDENVNFEKTVYPILVEQKKLAGFLTHHRYYSVGSHQRLPLTKGFFKQQPTIILDRDGVINKKMPRANYVTTWDEFEWLPGAKEAIKRLNLAGYRVLLATNQPGIARGMMSQQDLEQIFSHMDNELAAIGAKIDKKYFCPHGWDEGCVCRKPEPGMLFQAQKDFNLNLANITFIGDDIRDQQAGQAAGCQTILLGEEDSLLKAIESLIGE